MPEKTRNNLLNKRVGAMLTATGSMFRMMSLQVFAEKGFEITPEQYLILSIIMDSGGELYQRQISEQEITRQLSTCIILKKQLTKLLLDRKRKAG